MISCEHLPCTCTELPVERDDIRYCSELCADASQLPESDAGVALCPCLHLDCEANGDKANISREADAHQSLSR